MGRTWKGPAFALAALLSCPLPAHADKIVLRLADGLPTTHIINKTIVEPFISR
jgi:hypothetical protein